MPKHIDAVKPGMSHHRFNFTVKRASCGGVTLIQGIEQSGRGYVFRPDIAEHEVSEVQDGELILFSVGWLTKNK